MTRRGIAIAGAMYLLLILTGLILVSLADAGESHRAALREEHHVRALSAAERAVADALRAWDVSALEVLEPSQTTDGVETVLTEPPWPLSAQVRTTRLGDQLFWVAARGISGSGADRAERRIALVVEHAFPASGAAAIHVEGDAAIGQGFAVSTAEGERCGSTETGLIAARSDARIEFAGDSIPVHREELTMTAAIDAALSAPGSSPAASALELPPGSVMSLPFAAPGGDSASSRAPLVVTQGDLTLVGGSGSAFLLVAGRLHIEGATRLRGVVLARGGITISHPAARVTGTIVVPPVSSALLKEGGVIGSPCAARAAMRSLARPVPVGRRGWFELW